MKCDELESKSFDGGRTAYELMEANGLLNTSKKVRAAIDELKQVIKYKEGVGKRWFDRCMEARALWVKNTRALWLARAERYKMREFIAREEGNLCNQMSWSRFLRERTYNQWVGQLLRIANLANKLHKKCLAKAEKYK